ncbi:kinase-like domain-containing protein [Trametes polyzona]|nr:kinase-like domain-containing protein [Trametes polyzona]
MSPPVTDLIPDLTFKFIDSGRYQILNRLGAGTYGAVYRARERDPKSGLFIPRAIKVVPQGKWSKNYHLREVSIHNMLPKHPNIISLHRAFQEGPLMFIVMDLFDGGDLHQHISRKHTLCRNDGLIKDVFLRIVDGVEASHNLGIFHRDLKPENILVNADLTRVCLADFGLATTATRSCSFNTGSRYYMSPECIDCDDRLYPYDTRRSDIWALGVILLNMVTGHRAWDKATLQDTQFRAFLEDENWLRTVLPISKGFDDILRRIFTIIPDDSLSLAEIRREVRNLDTFYMAEEDIRSSTCDVKYMWHWYFPRQASLPSQAVSTNSEGGLDSWTSSESSESDDEVSSSDDSASFAGPQAHPQIPGTELLVIAEEGRLVLPRSLGAIQPASLLHLSSGSVSSDEFPIRRPATRRAMLPPPSESSSRSGSPSTEGSDGSPITPETHAQEPTGVVAVDPIEPLVLEGPILCHGKDSIRQKHGSVGWEQGRVATALYSSRSS